MNELLHTLSDTISYISIAIICYGAAIGLLKFIVNEADRFKHTFLLAKEEEETLGFCSYELNCEDSNKVKIHKIYILPDTQGKGLGKLLIQKIQDLAQKNNSDALSLNVNRFNVAKSFYEKIGFKIVAEEDIEIGEGWLMEDYVMEKSL